MLCYKYQLNYLTSTAIDHFTAPVVVTQRSGARCYTGRLHLHTRRHSAREANRRARQVCRHHRGCHTRCREYNTESDTRQSIRFTSAVRGFERQCGLITLQNTESTTSKSQLCELESHARQEDTSQECQGRHRHQRWGFADHSTAYRTEIP